MITKNDLITSITINAFNKEELITAIKIDYFNILNLAYQELLRTNYRPKIDEVQISYDLYCKIEILNKQRDNRYTVVFERIDNSLDLKSGGKHPKHGKKFDIFFENWDYKNSVHFGFEAKILVEKNIPKRNAKNLIKKYISDEGMGKFLNKIYETQGCMVGYIVSGDVTKIIEMINDEIRKVMTPNQILVKSVDAKIANPNTYISEHLPVLDFSLYHLMFKFH